MIYWTSRPLAAKTRNYHGLKIVFLESTGNSLSVDASLLHKKTVFGYKKYFLPSFSSCVIEKDVKANIFLFRTLWFIELQGPLQQKLEFITVWKLYFWNLRSIDFLSMPHCCIKRQYLDIKSKFFQLCDRKGRES